MLTEQEAPRVSAALRSGDRVRILDAQTRLGVTPDGVPGPVTFGALAALWPASYPLRDETPERWSYHKGMRRFGARRSGGRRKHAGCDLYARRGTPVYAVASGTVTSIGPFYAGTDQVTVDHGGFVVRYGEVEAVKVREGERVKRGQRIAAIGHLQGINVPSDMLHFELYSGEASGPLTDRGRAPYFRRADLLDPTAALDQWAKSLPA